MFSLKVEDKNIGKDSTCGCFKYKRQKDESFEVYRPSETPQGNTETDEGYSTAGTPDKTVI